VTGIHFIACAILLLSACTDGKTNGASSNGKTDAGWLDWHNSKRAVEARIDELTDAPGGPDCPAIIDVYAKSGWPKDIIDLDVGGTIVGCYGNQAISRRPVQSLSQGFDLMEKAAVTKGEAGLTAPQHLRLWFERGVGKAPNYVMAPIPEVAACWMKVEKDSYDDKIDDPAQVTTCIALRKKFMTKS
jgi:hypothetical protein